jgi:hypothetical protein
MTTKARFLIASVLLASSAFVGLETNVDPERAPTHLCSGKMTLPVEISISGNEAAIYPGVSVVSASVTAQTDIASAIARYVTTGSAALDGPSSVDLGSLPEGKTVLLSIPVRFTDLGQAEVRVWIDAHDASGTLLWSRRETLYALIRPGRTLLGQSSFHALFLREIQEDQAVGLLDASAARARQLALVETPATRDDSVPKSRAFTPDEALLNQAVGAPPQGHAIETSRFSPSGGTITVQGNVQWTDENGTTHPVFGASVNIFDDDGILGDEFITAVPTDVSGNYSAVIGNDDGPFQGNRDVFVRVVSFNTLVDTKDDPGNRYTMTSPVHDETPDGTVINESFTAGNSGGGEAWSVFQAGTWIAVYARMRNGGSALPSVEIEWPTNENTSKYTGKINILQLDRWDWDVTMHEYGHYTADQLNTEDNPGGPHNFGDCISDTGSATKDRGVKLAWGEGWPTYNGTVAQQILNLAALNVPRVGDVNYQDTEDLNSNYSLDAQDANGHGEDNETAVQRLLWDLFDSVNDGRDAIARSDQNIWTTLDGVDPVSLSAAWAALRSGQNNQTDLLMGEIASDQSIGPRLIAPVAGALVTPASASFSWNRDVGCSGTHDGDSFDLVFYNAATFAKVLTIPGLSSPSGSLTQPQIATLTASSHNILWAVEGRNGDSPATGPYLGENNPITVNQPPVANAGPDQPSVECSSHTTTPASLNGTASSDPDNDSLGYTWTAPGVTFDDPNSATPVGQFSEGTTLVTLTVSDGIQTATDTVSITVVDTIPPAIVCPENVTVECTGNCGIQADDPQLTGFFAGVQASDVCDATPTIGNNAPSFIPLGTTPVVFTATDDDLNAASCTAYVTVVDTTPPTITVTLNRDALWPPNHTMSSIVATVTVADICDPHPTFVLTSITSNEPDNGTGDGDFPNDIQGAGFGTADTSFQLRSERSGRLSGRVYTIVYTASDKSGNTTPATLTVRVPHDQRASFSSGAGAKVTPGVPDFEVILLSRPGFDATKIEWRRAWIGNSKGVVAPRGRRRVDVNHDGALDLVLTYPVGPTLKLRSSSSDEQLGLHYRDAKGVDTLIPNVLKEPPSSK